MYCKEGHARTVKMKTKKKGEIETQKQTSDIRHQRKPDTHN